MDLFKYYGIDWLLFLLVVIHLWMLGNQQKEAFLLGVVACSCGIIFGIMIDSVASVLMNITFAVMHLRAYFRWRNYNG